ncbi:hypothetical protein ACIP6X_41320 [Streptomyces coeruleorubidus]|uniref:hypothetical protein n=1 Tax=Streptomyces coeruleorubidus TaxID=116188 RepID=UPI003803D599
MTMGVGNSAGDLGLPARWCICHRGGMSNSGGRRSWMPWHRAGRQAAETTVHVAEVWHVRLNQQPRREKDRVDPYFVACCSCGWVGEAVDDSDALAEPRVRAEAFSHTSQVRAEVTYPLD